MNQRNRLENLVKTPWNKAKQPASPLPTTRAAVKPPATAPLTQNPLLRQIPGFREGVRDFQTSASEKSRRSLTGIVGPRITKRPLATGALEAMRLLTGAEAGGGGGANYAHSEVGMAAMKAYVESFRLDTSIMEEKEIRSFYINLQYATGPEPGSVTRFEIAKDKTAVRPGYLLGVTAALTEAAEEFLGSSPVFAESLKAELREGTAKRKETFESAGKLITKVEERKTRLEDLIKEQEKAKGGLAGEEYTLEQYETAIAELQRKIGILENAASVAVEDCAAEASGLGTWLLRALEDQAKAEEFERATAALLTAQEFEETEEAMEENELVACVLAAAESKAVKPAEDQPSVTKTM